MILLDTDHLSVMRFHTSDRARRLIDALSRSPDGVIGTSVVNVEESMRGWMATLAKERMVQRHISPYRELAELFTFFAGMAIVLFDEPAVVRFEELKRGRIPIGTNDLKIASVALANNALLLTVNRRDFEKVPGLRFENWLDA